ncbi:hypothetical protein GF325_12740 [Candidatus Bathyarchaeota archaeon]|nr:hypothetical protein [Candidatus Bathyarchaeota archaeon]
MSITKILVEISMAVLGVVVIFLVGCLVLGIFLKVRDAITRPNNKESQVRLYTPLMEILKSLSRDQTKSSTQSKTTRVLVLLAWFFSTAFAIAFLPIGQYSLAPNVFGQYQVLAVFSLLMVYPVGIMVLAALTSRKSEIRNLKFLSEDFLSSFITFLVTMLSLVIVYQGGLNFPSLPTIQELMEYQQVEMLNIIGVSIPSLFAILAPLSMISFFSIIPFTFRPMHFGNESLIRKWTPISTFTGKSRALVKILEVFRFMALVILFIDFYFAGGIISANEIVNLAALGVMVIFVALLLSFVKTKKRFWVLDRKVIGFIKVHNLLAGTSFIILLVLVMIYN